MTPLFEDNHLLILNKPSGLLTQPSGTEQDSLEGQAKAWIKERDCKPGNVFLEAVHRLDKPVSGAVVFAKTSKALGRLNQSMRAKQTRKIYWAWLEGELPSDQGTLVNYLLHDDFHAQVVDSSHSEGKMARLSYRVLHRKRERTLLEIELETGRYHQIRLQFGFLGYPVWGDLKYGGQRLYDQGSIALHHRCIEIPHPVTHETLRIEAPLPAIFNQLRD